jgi:hypothetical protein
MTKGINEQLLDDDPESQAVEADLDDVQFAPEPSEDDQVIAIEPEIISIGRGKRKKALRELSQEGG